jgi:outer membrane protein
MRNLFALTLLFILPFWGQAQQEPDKKADSVFTLQEAIDYARENNYDVARARLEVTKARKKVWETTAIGLPQISGKFDYSYMLTVPETLEQFSDLGALFNPIYYSLNSVGVLNDQQLEGILANMPTETVSKDDIRWGATLDVTLTQLIFNGSYIVGLQASKTYQHLSKYMEQQSVAELEEMITNAYSGVLIAKESMAVLDDILKATNTTVAEMEAMYEEGFVENTDVDQLKLTAATIETSKKNLELQIQTAREMLKLSMGMSLEHPLKLSDKLDNVLTHKEVLTTKEFDFDVTKNINYQLLETQEKLTELDLKNSKADFLPTVAAFYNHQENFNDNSFNLTPPDVVGVSVNIPIFSSWGRMSKVAQKEIELEQTRLDKAKATSGLQIQYRNTLNQYLTAKNTYLNNKSNMELARRIYEKTQIKNKEGVASSFDLSQAQTQFLQAQGNYFQSVMLLIEAKAGLDKLSHPYQPLND